MNLDWLTISAIASFIIGCILLFVLAAFYCADQADDFAEYERRMAEGDKRLADVLRGK